VLLRAGGSWRVSSWAQVEPGGRNRALSGFIGIKNRPSSDIGREFGGGAPESERESNQRRSENNDSNCWPFDSPDVRESGALRGLSTLPNPH
jgi:hypothetical protein